MQGTVGNVRVVSKTDPERKFLRTIAAAKFWPILKEILDQEWHRQVWDQLPPSEGMPSATCYSFQKDWEADALYHLPGIPVELGAQFAQLTTVVQLEPVPLPGIPKGPLPGIPTGPSSGIPTGPLPGIPTGPRYQRWPKESVFEPSDDFSEYVPFFCPFARLFRWLNHVRIEYSSID